MKIPHCQNIRIASASIAVALSAMLAGCFTGIESTPKITAGDVRREQAQPNPDDDYPGHLDYGHFPDWRPDKRFVVNDSKIGMVLHDGNGAEARLLSGDTIILTGIDEMPTLTGENELVITFRDRTGKSYGYRTGRTADAVKKEEVFEIPFAVEESLVEQVRRKMKGESYYTVSATWLDTLCRPRQGRKFVPVRVTDVTAGNAFYQVLLHLDDENGEPFTLYMNVGSGIKAPRRFSSMLSLENPRKRYPDITEDTWRNIINGKVALDMTRDECRLALGTPDNVDRTPGYSILREVWTYENGVYLIFEDGLLRRFRQ